MCQAVSYTASASGGALLIEARMQPWNTAKVEELRGWLAAYAPTIEVNSRAGFRWLTQTIVSFLGDGNQRDKQRSVVTERLKMCCRDAQIKHMEQDLRRWSALQSLPLLPLSLPPLPLSLPPLPLSLPPLPLSLPPLPLNNAMLNMPPESAFESMDWSNPML